MGTWQLDPYHTQVEFSAKHLGMMTVRGHFAEVSASGDIDPEHPESSSVEATISTAGDHGDHGDREQLIWPEPPVAGPAAHYPPIRRVMTLLATEHGCTARQRSPRPRGFWVHEKPRIAGQRALVPGQERFSGASRGASGPSRTAGCGSP